MSLYVLLLITLSYCSSDPLLVILNNSQVIKSKTFMAAVQENIEKVHVTRRILQTEQIEKNKRIAAERLADLSHKFKSSLVRTRD